MKTEKELKEIFVKLIGEFQDSDDGKEIIFWDELYKFYCNFEGGEILKNKTKNLLKMMNESKSISDEEFKEFIKRDIETDIWYIV